MPHAPSTASARVGSLLDARYRLTRLLGEGGMGAVFEADDTRMRRRVAVKVMSPSFSQHPDSTQRFLREAQTAAQLSHPHVVTVHDLGVEPDTGAFYLVQEFLTGCDLRAVMERLGPLSLDEALSVMVPALEGLAAAHERGVVHRDLKPDNIFLSRSAGGVTPKVIDFGIAKVLEHNDQDFRTRTMQILGTPGYMSREQARALGGLDGRTDVWSAAVVLYELLTGQLPYDAPNAHAMLARILTEHPLPLAALRPGLPAEFLRALDGALQPDRDLRFATMGAFLDALAACEVPRLREPPRIAALLGVGASDRPQRTPSEPARTPPYTPVPPRAMEPPRTPPPVATMPSNPAMVAPPRPPTALAWSEVTPTPPRHNARPAALAVTGTLAVITVAAFALLRITPQRHSDRHVTTPVTPPAAVAVSVAPTPIAVSVAPTPVAVPVAPVAPTPVAPVTAVVPSRAPTVTHPAVRVAAPSHVRPRVAPLGTTFLPNDPPRAPAEQVGANGAVILN